MKSILVTLFLPFLTLAACGVPVDNQTTINNDSYNQSSNPTQMTSASEKSAELKAKNKELQLRAPAKGETVAIMDTDFGTIKIKLFTDQAPEISKNFIELAKAKKYEGAPFHRVIKDFMIQTGDFNKKNGTGGYSYKGPDTKLNDEISPNLRHYYGTVSMANAGPNTNGSQFFIVTNKNGTPHLDGGYSIFGQVYEGMDIAEKIQSVHTNSNDKPDNTITIKSIKIEVL